MQPRRIAAAAALGLPAAFTALALVETASLHFKNRDHTLHFGDPRFGIIGHLPIGQPRRYVDGCRYCDTDRVAAGHWTRSYSFNTELSQPGHVDPVDGCVHCQDRTSPNPGTALAELDEQEQQWLRDVRSRMGLRARAGEVVLEGIDVIFDRTVGPLCDGLEAVLWRWFPAAPQPSSDAA